MPARHGLLINFRRENGALSVEVGMPVLTRRLHPASIAEISPRPVGDLATAALAMDRVDGAIIAVMVGVVLWSKLTEKASKKPLGGKASHHQNLSKVVDLLPLADAPKTADPSDAMRRKAALQGCLQGIKHEVSELLLDGSEHVIGDVVLWQFCENPQRMRVAARLNEEADSRSYVDAFQLQAFYVAKRGECMAEHDFSSSENPFPKIRQSPVEVVKSAYKSILFIPITITADVQHTPENDEDDDYCIGVICIESSRPYRFWRWGDHKHAGSTFATVAFDKARPYIKLLRRLTVANANRIRFDV